MSCVVFYLVLQYFNYIFTHRITVDDAVILITKLKVLWVYSQIMSPDWKWNSGFRKLWRLKISWQTSRWRYHNKIYIIAQCLELFGLWWSQWGTFSFLPIDVRNSVFSPNKYVTEPRGLFLRLNSNLIFPFYFASDVSWHLITLRNEMFVTE